MWRVLFALLLFAVPSHAQRRLISLDGYVVRVNPSGTVMQVFKVPSKGADLKYGTSDPIVAPNRKYIAFIQDHNAYLRPVRGGPAEKLTTAGKSGSDKLLPVDVFLIGFAPDGKSLLYSVAPGKNECPDCPNHHPKRQEADYGQYRLDLTTRKVEKLSVPGNMRVFKVLDDGRIFSTDVGDYGDQFGVFDLAAAKFTAFPKQCAGAMDCGVDRAGHRAVCVDVAAGQSQVISCDLAASTAAAEPISDKGKCPGQFSLPKRSPGDKHSSYVELLGCTKDKLALNIDGKNVYQCEGLSNYTWIDDERLLVHCAMSLDAINASGKKLGGIAAEPSAKQREQ